MKDKGRVILGIDPGTGRCGFAVVSSSQGSAVSGRRGNSPKLIDCGCIETKANTPLDERLEVIFKKITDLIKVYKPEEMAIEELFFVKNIKTGMSVAHARGVIILAARLAKVPHFEYKPNEVKLAITGYGHADKNQIRKMLTLHLKGCNIKQDDAADAVAVALCHLQMARKLSAVRVQESANNAKKAI